MSVLRIKDQSGGWRSITSLKGDRGEQGNSDSQLLAKQLSELMVFDKMQLIVDNYEIGTWSYSSKAANSTRIRSKMLYPVKAGYKVLYTNPSLKLFLGILQTKTSSAYIQYLNWRSVDSSEREFTITKDGYLNVILETNDETSASLNNFDTEVTIVSTGFSPERGVDYWTAADKAEIIQDVVDEVGIQTVTVSGTTPTITGVENTRYICGEVSTISITPPSQGIIDVIFTSGSTVAVLTLPQTVMMPDNFAIEANKIYEINILDGIYGAVTSWEVPS